MKKWASFEDNQDLAESIGFQNLYNNSKTM